jgi:NAD(P)-dependent dehydrogenase (short-subunit alcohol dehydrogenase family)
VNTIVAGGFDTPILDFATPESLAEVVKEFARPQRLGRPEEFARFAAHIVETTTSTPRHSASTPATGSRPEAVFRVGFGRR